MKTCIGCKRELPLTMFGVNRRVVDGLSKTCLECFTERRLVGRAARSSDPNRWCPRCRQTLPRAAFDRQASTPDGLQCYCRDCKKVIRVESEARNAEARQLRFAERLARTPDPQETKECRKCGEPKPMLSFYAHRGTKDRRANYCMECSAAYGREWRRANAEKVREQNAKRDPARAKRNMRARWLRLYNLTEDSFAALLEAQGDACAICQQAETAIDKRTGKPRALAVDHCHKTGRIRGLLCMRCNSVLGMVDDDPQRLIAAVNYLAAAIP